MRITSLGHAGLYLETEHGSVLCDPWFSPAFFASWFPFPANHGLDVEAVARPDYLYVSHSHDDHLDARFLRERVWKDAVVILPDFPTDDHRRALEDLGFHRFVQTRNGEVADLDGLRVLTNALVAPTDGAIGDSGLALSDGRATVFNQNDSKPTELAALRAFGPYDVHFVQFSGAIWYPAVYRLPAAEKQALTRRKRANQLARAARFVDAIDATRFVPFAGPPCFLDEPLFHLNDLGDGTNIFADQTVALRAMQERGDDRGLLAVPGTVLEVGGGRCEVVHPDGPEAVERPFVDKARYLREYQEWAAPRIAAEKATWSRGDVDLVAALAEWWDPLLATADRLAEGVGARVLVAAGDEPIVVDFLERRVRRGTPDECRYRYRFPRELVATCVERHDTDWVNALFLSCRFEAERDGPYNEFVYNFFRSLSPERMAYSERYYSEVTTVDEYFEAGGYRIQRRCPHLRADLTRFGSVEDGVLTCAVHGWRFELESGRCLTSDDRRLECVRLEADADRGVPAT